jgi:hypothetical protein
MSGYNTNCTQKNSTRGKVPQKKEFYQFYIHTYHSRFIAEGVAKVPKVFLRDAHVLPKLLSYE